MAFSAVLSVSYVSKKFYGDIAGISAGFLIMSSYLFTRLVSPLPETMAIIFVPLAIYLYYQSIVTEKYKYALIGSFLFLLVILTHQATTNISILVHNYCFRDFKEKENLPNQLRIISVCSSNRWINCINCFTFIIPTLCT